MAKNAVSCEDSISSSSGIFNIVWPKTLFMHCDTFASILFLVSYLIIITMWYVTMHEINIFIVYDDPLNIYLNA